MTDKETNAINAAVYALSQDAARYRKLRARFKGADFTYAGGPVLLFDFKERERASASLDDTIDRWES